MLALHFPNWIPKADHTLELRLFCIPVHILQEIRRLLLLLIGVAVAALGYSIFQVPYTIAAGGISGIGILVNHFTGWSVGLSYFVLNIPLLILGFSTWGGGLLFGAR